MVPDSNGHILGVPVPRPIMPPLMCVLPQADGSPSLVPMLPAMYLATCGKNTPEFMGTIPLQQSQVDSLAGMPPFPGLAPENGGISGMGPAGPFAGPGATMPGMMPGFGHGGHPGGPMWLPRPEGGDVQPQGMPAGRVWPLGPRNSGPGGSHSQSTLPPLLAEPRVCRHREGRETGLGKASNGPHASPATTAHTAALPTGSQEDSKDSRRNSGDYLDKGDKPWTPKTRGERAGGCVSHQSARPTRRQGSSKGSRSTRRAVSLSADRFAGIKLESDSEEARNVAIGVLPPPEVGQESPWRREALGGQRSAQGEINVADVDALLHELQDDEMAGGMVEDEGGVDHKDDEMDEDEAGGTRGLPQAATWLAQ
jgi:hypothetical protein